MNFCRFSIFLSAGLVSAIMASAQGVTQCGVPTGQPQFPLESYTELPDPSPVRPEAWKNVGAAKVAWGSTYVRYVKHEVPGKSVRGGTTLSLAAWRGERVGATAMVWGSKPIEQLTVSVGKFSNGKQSLPASAITAAFVRYVMTDGQSKDGNNCGTRNHSELDSSLVADAIDQPSGKLSMEAMSTRPIWVTCQVPENQPSGMYTGKISIMGDGRQIGNLTLKINILQRTLPSADKWAFHLDLWQNPFAVARYYQVPLWSDAHLTAMRPLMTRLARAGQKVITVSMMEKPWNGQTEDYFPSMITWEKRVDGTWSYDFGVFDRWVEFMMGCGITQQINCYSVIPWSLSFRYFDQASNSLKAVKAEPGTEAYEAVWLPMLKAFAQHLKEKGWFERTTIAMDERPMEAMRKALVVIRKADPDFKVSLAGTYHKEIESDLHDYCIGIGQKFPEEVLARRTKEGKYSTYYTCCSESHPNTFTFSAPAEAAWLGYYCAAANASGYLRWAYNSWVREPLLDSRFRTWSAGDTYLVYPGDRSSIRFEKLVEGIEGYEKVRLLRQEYTSKGELKKLRKLNSLLSKFILTECGDDNARRAVEKINLFVNGN
jgi:hypothetical protein